MRVGGWGLGPGGLQGWEDACTAGWVLICEVACAAQRALCGTAPAPWIPNSTSHWIRVLLPAGTLALQRCDDDMRLLQLEVGELQRRVFATHKTAPDVVSYDRQVCAAA